MPHCWHAASTVDLLASLLTRGVNSRARRLTVDTQRQQSASSPHYWHTASTVDLLASLLARGVNSRPPRLTVGTQRQQSASSPHCWHAASTVGLLASLLARGLHRSLEPTPLLFPRQICSALFCTNNSFLFSTLDRTLLGYCSAFFRKSSAEPFFFLQHPMSVFFIEISSHSMN